MEWNVCESEKKPLLPLLKHNTNIEFYFENLNILELYFYLIFYNIIK